MDKSSIFDHTHCITENVSRLIHLRDRESIDAVLNNLLAELASQQHAEILALGQQLRIHGDQCDEAIQLLDQVQKEKEVLILKALQFKTLEPESDIWKDESEALTQHVRKHLNKEKKLLRAIKKIFSDQQWQSVEKELLEEKSMVLTRHHMMEAGQ